MKIKLWGDSATNMSEREKARLKKFIQSNLAEKTEIEFIVPTAEDIKKADTKSKRGGVDGGTGSDTTEET